MLLQWTGEFQVVDNSAQRIAIADNFVGSLRFAGPGIDAVDNDATLDRIIPAFRTFWGNNAAGIPGPCVVTTLKWNRINTAGKYASTTATRLREGLDIHGYGSIVYPNQIALAVSWGTDAKRGLAHQGRTYMPTNLPLNGNDYQLTAQRALQTAEVYAGFIRSLNAAVNGGGNVSGDVNDGNSTADPVSGCVASVMSDIREGATRPIVRVRVGRTFDQQSRRRNMFRESYGEWLVSGVAP